MGQPVLIERRKPPHFFVGNLIIIIMMNIHVDDNACVTGVFEKGNLVLIPELWPVVMVGFLITHSR